MRVCVIVQARMGSKRLPGKVLMDVAGEPMVAHVVRRAMSIPRVDGVLVAIPDLPEDDVLADAIASRGIQVVRGNASDVLGRYRVAAQASSADAVVRVTADCPVLSPSVSGLVVDAFLRGDVDYCSNTIHRTWPRGTDTEVFTTAALVEADAEAKEPAEREHVTPFIWRRPERYRLRSVTQGKDRSDVRLTVDTAEDLELVRSLFAELGTADFELSDVLNLLNRRPDLRQLNASIRQKPLL